MAFVVNSISAKSDYPVTTSSGTVILPVTAQIWTLLSPRPATWYVDGTGSKEPRIFSIPRTTEESYDVSIQLEGLFTFPSSWTGQYVIQAYPNGLSTPILESHRHIVPPPTNPPIPIPIKIDSFKASSPFKDFVCPIPFRWAGDFEWKISNVNVEGERFSWSDEPKPIPPAAYEGAVTFSLNSRVLAILSSHSECRSFSSSNPPRTMLGPCPSDIRSFVRPQRISGYES